MNCDAQFAVLCIVMQDRLLKDLITSSCVHPVCNAYRKPSPYLSKPKVLSSCLLRGRMPKIHMSHRRLIETLVSASSATIEASRYARLIISTLLARTVSTYPRICLSLLPSSSPEGETCLRVCLSHKAQVNHKKTFSFEKDMYRPLGFGVHLSCFRWLTHTGIEVAPSGLKR